MLLTLAGVLNPASVLYSTKLRKNQIVRQSIPS